MASKEELLSLRVIPCSRQDGKVRVSISLLLDCLLVLMTVF